MFINNINPVILDFGAVQIRYYGIVYALGVIMLYVMLLKDKKKLGINRDIAENITLFLMIGMFVGARLFSFLFSEPMLLVQKPLEFFMVWHGGMSFFGGIIGAFIAGYFYLKKKKIEWRKLADTAILPVTLALALGRIANFANGELLGTPSNLPWCVVFPQTDMICRHPYQLYASLSHFILFGALLFLRKQKMSKGTVFYSFLIGYGILRLIIDFFRDDARILGLTIWQHMCIISAAIGIVMIAKNKKRKQEE
jgi:phosphatidylglycerol---prolipoprotein diacylglyceryl transferase